ncbi:MAG: hypothetical protein EA349_15975 [Halomonadaceae bacterium]|nr:MAG: hypothetical protein EA349_15975 [Halomonadaceae bacterium]
MKLFKLKSRKQPVTMAPDACFSNGVKVTELLAECLPGTLSEAIVLNHHGLMSLRVAVNGRAYKVAECASDSRAALAEQALRLVAEHGGPVPPFVARKGPVIIVHWIEGQLCNELPQQQQRELLLQSQCALYAVPVPPALGIKPDYIHIETLTERLRHEAAGVLSSARIEGIVENLWQRLPDPEKVHVIHPDLTPVNLVLTREGPVIIDNEVIGLGVGREFDVWHSAEALYGYRDPAALNRYSRDYHERSPGSSLFSHQPLWDDWRLLRRALKSVEKRRLIKARLLFKRLGH